MSATVLVCDTVKKRDVEIKQPEPLLERIPKTSNEKKVKYFCRVIVIGKPCISWLGVLDRFRIVKDTVVVIS